MSGIGGTLSGNALAMSALRATLSTTLRQEDYDYMEPLATKWADGVHDGYHAYGASVARSTTGLSRGILVLSAPTQWRRSSGSS